MIKALYIGNEKLDLFEDDNIFIKNSVSKIEDITKVFTETSNSFSVPATDNNNKIFKHYYNASINNPFDARKLVLGAIYLDGLHHKTVNFKLNKVIVKSQKANSYSLEFFGLLTSLKDLLGKDKLTDLDFSAYNFTYNYTNVKNKLTGQNLSDTNILNTLLTSKRYIYDLNTNTVNTDTVRNLANNNTANTSGIVYQDSNSSIKTIRIIEAIEAKYSITFSREFFSTDNFSLLYLLMNGGGSERVFSEFVTPPTLGTITDVSEIEFSVSVPNGDLFGIAVYQNNQEIFKKENLTIAGSIGIAKGDVASDFSNLTYQVFSKSIINYSSTIEITGRDNNNNIIQRTSTRPSGVISAVFLTSGKMPDITVIDFLKGIFQMFKLIVIPTSDTNLFVDTSVNYYNSGTNRDVTKFIDFSKQDINSGEFINEISYEFEEAKTLLAKQFKTLNGIDYGNLELKILGENGKIIEGNTIDFKLPFENIVYEKLTEVLYGLLQDENEEPVEIKPHLHYIRTEQLTANLKILDDSSNVQLISNLCMPTHLKNQNTTTFGEEIDEYSGAIMSNTLYKNYHETFIVSSFSIKRRLYNYKLKNATIDLINNLRLNDNIIIKDRAYRIDNYNTNITTKEIDFNLINIT
jgi:hypothetical protein